MTSIMDMKPASSGIWTQISNIFMPLRYLAMSDNIKQFLADVDINYLLNAIFWIFLLFFLGFLGFYQVFHIFLKTSKIKFYKQAQFARSLWNIAFFAASTIFLYFYNEYMVSPQLLRNIGSLFPTFDNSLFFKSETCNQFKFYSLIIITFYLHSALLDIKENDNTEASTKAIYSLALMTMNYYRFENYFVSLNLLIGYYQILTECLYLLVLQNPKENNLMYETLLVLRIASWSYIFICSVPFNYLIPTLFAKNFKLSLNAFIWLWYGLAVWNSPVLQFFYHQSYHKLELECSGDGSAAKCILMKECLEDRHFKALQKAYLEVKLSNAKLYGVGEYPITSENQAAKSFQAIKCIMTLKRKLKRIRSTRNDLTDGGRSGLSPKSSVIFEDESAESTDQESNVTTDK